MTSQPIEGQTFAQDYVLDKQLTATASRRVWSAFHKQTGERCLLHIFQGQQLTEAWSVTTARVDQLKGLLHENIVLISSHGQDDDNFYLVEPFIGGEPIDPGKDLSWPLLQQLIDGIQYAHNLGIAHGRLRPGNLLVDKSHQLHITGFGRQYIDDQGESDSARVRDYLSPQIQAGNQPDISDDVYSLGALIFEAVTGKTWHPGVELDTPISPALESQLTAMLSQNTVDRQIELQTLMSSLDQHFNAEQQTIQSVSFSRSGDSPVSSIATANNGPNGGQPAPIDASPQSVRQKKGMSAQWVAIAGGGLTVIALLVFLLLPRLASPPEVTQTSNQSASKATPSQPQTSQQSTPAAPALTPLEKAAIEAMEQQGEAVARDILRLQLDLEDIGVSLWAGDEYRALANDLDEADAMYREQRFEAALAAYETVRNSLEILKDRAPAELAMQQVLGDEALAAGEAEAALTAFTIAVAIDAGDKSLADRLERAENLPAVLGLVRQAEATERNGELSAALDLFQQAVAIDARWPAANAGQQRIQEALTRNRFRDAMSKGFQAVANKQYDDAKAAFEAARSILPGSSEPDDGLLQVTQAERADLIATHRETANAHMAASAWQLAIDAYDAALAITPALEFATTGKAEAEYRLDLETSLKLFLNDPTPLQLDEKLQEARNLLRNLSRIANPSVALGTDMNTLAQLVSTARITIPVTITSDGKTDVTVRRHAALGSIENEVVYLIPGRYTIVGQRPGYRDVRKDIVIIAGRTVDPIHISSSERVR